jgi:transglutaminase-like putative cysteine protease
MMVARRLGQHRLPLSILAIIAVALLAAYLFLSGANQFGIASYVAIGVILLALGLSLGLRCFLAALVLWVVAVFAWGYFFMAPPVLRWDANQQVKLPALVQDGLDEPGLVQFRKDYQLDEVVRGSVSDYERLQKLVHWVNGRWQHNGNNQPSKPDPLTILQEASQGQSFRCVEYATVIAACARSMGFDARVLGLKRSDVETAATGAGHVVAEVWLDQFNKWVMVDAQWDAIPELNGQPLNAVELQDAVARNKDGLRIIPASTSGLPKEISYSVWVSSYLYYFDYTVDQRFFFPQDKNTARIMLVPVGAKEPHVMQQRYLIENCLYIANPALFYAHP